MSNTAAAAPEAHLFSPDDLATQVGAIELVMAMWQGDGELTVSDGDAESIRKVAEYLNLPLSELGNAASVKLKESIPSHVTLTLSLHPENGAETPAAGWKERKMLLDVDFPLRKPAGTAPRVRVRQPTWLTRASFDRVAQAVQGAGGQQDQEQDEDAVASIMEASERVSELVLEELSAATPAASQADAPDAPTTVLRTWSYLPSLSSKEKRGDLVSYAAAHDPPLTGFVLAGKPGLVVLEHPFTTAQKASNAIDSFWSRIKAESWADIPSGHKKVSERYREEDVPRVFTDFQEMTEREEVGGREVVPYGGKRNKSDLASLQVWLDGLGLQGRLERVLGADWHGPE